MLYMIKMLGFWKLVRYWCVYLIQFIHLLVLFLISSMHFTNNEQTKPAQINTIRHDFNVVILVWDTCMLIIYKSLNYFHSSNNILKLYIGQYGVICMLIQVSNLLSYTKIALSKDIVMNQDCWEYQTINYVSLWNDAPLFIKPPTLI